MTPKEIVLALVVIAGLVLVSAIAYQKRENHIATQSHQKAGAAHESGKANAQQGQSAQKQGEVAEQRAQSLQQKLDASDAKVARLKALLAKAHASKPVESGVAPDPGVPVAPPVTPDLKDQYITALETDNRNLRSQNTELKTAMVSFKASADFYKKAYADECKARDLDAIGYKAQIAAEKAGKWKVGILSFGGGAVAGGATTKILKL